MRSSKRLAGLDLGWIVFLPNGERNGGFGVIPDAWLNQLLLRETQIHATELIAALSAVFSMRKELAGMRVLHFIDNQGALSNLISGRAASRDVAALVVLHQMYLLQMSSISWYEYVETHLNCSDGPSRELRDFALSHLAYVLQVNMKEAELPPIRILFEQPLESLTSMFELLRSVSD